MDERMQKEANMKINVLAMQRNQAQDQIVNLVATVELQKEEIESLKKQLEAVKPCECQNEDPSKTV